MSDIRWNFRPYKGADVGGSRRGASNNLAIGNFRDVFNILKGYFKKIELLKSFNDVEIWFC